MKDVHLVFVLSVHSSSQTPLFSPFGYRRGGLGGSLQNGKVGQLRGSLDCEGWEPGQ